MKIGVIGSGIVGQTLAGKFAQLGHQVKVGTRDASKLTDWQRATGDLASVGTFAEAAHFGEVIVLATSWRGGATENAIKLADPSNFAGKVVIDVTNPLDFSSGAPRLSVGHTDSAGEQVQRWLPDARVVKTLNMVTADTMINPARSGGEPDMFIAGNDPTAKQTVTEILHAFGWQGVVDLGGIEASRYLEPLAMIWIVYAFTTQVNTHAFKLVGK